MLTMLTAAQPSLSLFALWVLPFLHPLTGSFPSLLCSAPQDLCPGAGRWWELTLQVISLKTWQKQVHHTSSEFSPSPRLLNSFLTSPATNRKSLRDSCQYQLDFWLKLPFYAPQFVSFTQFLIAVDICDSTSLVVGRTPSYKMQDIVFCHYHPKSLAKSHSAQEELSARKACHPAGCFRYILIFGCQVKTPNI